MSSYYKKCDLPPYTHDIVRFIDGVPVAIPSVGGVPKNSFCGKEWVGCQPPASPATGCSSCKGCNN